jgi:hypothetical protein
MADGKDNDFQACPVIDESVALSSADRPLVSPQMALSSTTYIVMCKQKQSQGIKAPQETKADILLEPEYRKD